MKKRPAISDQLYQRILNVLDSTERDEIGFDALVNRVATQCRVSVHEVRDALIRRGEAALLEQFAAIKEMKRHILPMARGLAKARRLYPKRQDFNRWLAQSPYRDFSRTELNCLRKIARHERLTAQVLSRGLEEEGIPDLSFPAIWREVLALVRLEQALDD
jgi:hypothetical protein